MGYRTDFSLRCRASFLPVSCKTTFERQFYKAMEALERMQRQLLAQGVGNHRHWLHRGVKGQADCLPRIVWRACLRPGIAEELVRSRPYLPSCALFRCRAVPFLNTDTNLMLRTIERPHVSVGIECSSAADVSNVL